MKKILLSIICFLPVALFAGNPPSKEEGGNSSDNTKISLYVPGFIMRVGSWLVPEEKDPEVKVALTKLRSTSIVVREGCAYTEYHASNKYNRKLHQLKRQDFEELVNVSDDDDKVSVQLRENKNGTIRQVVILADDGEESFVFLRVRCNVTMDDIKRWIKSDRQVKEKVDHLLDT